MSLFGPDEIDETITERIEEHDRIDVHFHFHGPITLAVTVQQIPPPLPAATRQRIHIGGSSMAEPGTTPTINVDTNDETATMALADDFGNVAAVPAGASAVFADANGVVTFTPDAANPLKSAIVPTGVPGTASITGDTLDANGASLGLPAPAAQALEVDPGAPVSQRMTLAEEPASPPPPATPPPA